MEPILKTDELKRYARQIILPELGIQGQQKLKQAKVLMVGAGGLGCPVLQYLTAGGVGTIGIVDDDVVDLSNLQRQILFTVNDLDNNKAIVAKQKLELLNPSIHINAFPERLTDNNILEIFSLYDVIIDGSDNFPTRYLINDACVKLNKPLIFGSIFKFEGQVSVFNYMGGPDYRHLFPEPPAADEAPNCAEVGVIGVLPGMIGAFMANEAVKVICDMGETLSGGLLCINALDNSIHIFRLGPTMASDVHDVQKAIPAEKASGDHSYPHWEIDMPLLNDWIEKEADEICMIDVRETYEFEDFNLGGINIPLFELEERISEIPKQKAKVIFYCQSGQRSEQAVHLMVSRLNAELFSLKGGINAISFNR